MKALIFGLHIALLAPLCTLLAKEKPKFPVSDIPEALMKDVDVVVREDQMEFTVLSQNHATSRRYRVITILNRGGEDYANEGIWYNKLSKVTSLKASVYDADGMLIRRLRPREITDRSWYDGFSLYSDARLKEADLSQNMYPYTVEFEYEIEMRYLFHVSDYEVLWDDRCALQHGVCRYVYPKALALRYRAYNLNVAPEVGALPGDVESLSWTFRDVKSIKPTSMGPDLMDVLPRIEVAPTQFEYDGYIGRATTWDEYGRWMNTLLKGRNILPEATKQKIHSLTAKAKTDEEKVKILYEYLQSKTRYVGIQVGIGGHQPFPASVVDQTGYGDCKALSNYMVSMLQEAGIKAHYVLVRAGEDAPALDASFPSHQFDHVIVSVPNKGDTLWLECTDQHIPFGYLGTFTGDRKALLITDNGAAVVRTKCHPDDQNIQSRTATVYVEPNGNAKARVVTTYRGLQYENNDLYSALHWQYDSQRKWVQKYTAIPSFQVNSFSLINHKDKTPSAQVTLDLTLDRFTPLNGKRIFLVPNLMNRSTVLVGREDERKTPVILESAFTDLDTIQYHLPEGILPEFLPEPVKITSRFGEYESRCTFDQGKLIYIRRLKQVKGQFPPESYKECADFYKGVNKADHVKIVLLSKT